MADENTSINEPEPTVVSRRNDVSTKENNDVSTQEKEDDVSVPNEQQPEGQQPAPQEPVWKTMITRMITFWIIMQVVKSFTGKKTEPSNLPADSVAKNIPSSNIPCHNLFKHGDNLELFLYYSENEHFNDFDNKNNLLWHEPQLVYGNWYDGPQSDGSRIISGKINISKEVQNNGSLYYHIFIFKQGYSPDPQSKYYSVYASSNITKLMTPFRKERIHKTKNLLTGEAVASSPTQTQNSNISDGKTISYWHPNLTINILDDLTPWTKGSVPAPLDQYIKFVENRYYPVVYINDYWNYISDYNPINETTPELEYYIIFSPISMFKWQLYISQGMRSQWNQYLGDTVEQSDQEQDMIKRTLRETNPYLLGLTMIVSIVHSVFEFLAFKNDIQFWKTRKSLEGLSVRSVFFNVFQTLVVLLYVLDNETNTIVVVSCFVGLLIECWKITKVTDIKIHPEKKWGPFPALTYEDKSTYVDSSTRKYDKLAFKYLSWALFPMLACYAIYSLIYNEHKGWYSFVLSIAYGFLLTFGFIMMTPQLFINYKLKSVAHLPWRMLTYKALNTFIDDIFAFVIKMPTLYRLGCLRDDVIFFIFLYQRWIYKIDMKRVNEFGTSGEPEVDNPNKSDDDKPDSAHSEESKKDK